MTPMDEAWLVLKYEGGFFTKPLNPKLGATEQRIANYERTMDEGRPYSGEYGDKYYNALYQQEEIAALNEAIQQELREQMNAQGQFTSGTFMADASPMMAMRQHNFPKAGEPSPPRGPQGDFMMRPYRGPDRYRSPLPIRAPMFRARHFPDHIMDMSFLNQNEGEVND